MATDVSFTGDADPHRPTGSVDCTPPTGSGADAVSVRLFDGIEGQGDAEVSTILTKFGGGLAPAKGGGSPLPTVGCGSSWISSGRWTLADRDAGAILCYRGSEGGRVAKDEDGRWVERGAAWLYWSYADPPIFAWAMREDGDSAALYDWWSKTARFVAP